MKFAICIGLVFLSIVSCTSKQKIVKNDVLTYAPKEQPQVEVKITMQSIESIGSLKGKVAVMFISNYPDAYLIKAKEKIFPPGLAIEEVKAIEQDRNEWLNQAIVSACEECKGFDTLLPVVELKEDSLLSLMDKAARYVDVSLPEIIFNSDKLKKYKYLWIITSRADTDQKRGFTEDSKVVGASSYRIVDMKSIIFDTTSKEIVSSASIRGADQETILYTRQNEGIVRKASKLIPQVFKSSIAHGEDLMDTKYDEIYPFPPEPEVYYIIQKSLYKTVEVLNP